MNYLNNNYFRLEVGTAFHYPYSELF